MQTRYLKQFKYLKSLFDSGKASKDVDYKPVGMRTTRHAKP